jgi:hypothetical protein
LTLIIAHFSNTQRKDLMSGELNGPNFQKYMEDKIPHIPGLHNGKDIDTLVVNFSGSILGALVASNSKLHTQGDTLPQILPSIQDELRLRMWQVIRDTAPRAKINRLKRWVT